MTVKYKSPDGQIQVEIETISDEVIRTVGNQVQKETKDGLLTLNYRRERSFIDDNEYRERQQQLFSKANRVLQAMNRCNVKVSQTPAASQTEEAEYSTISEERPAPRPAQRVIQ